MPLEKSPENLRTCQICKKVFKGRKGMSSHFRRIHHISSQEHFDKFYKIENEGKCIACNKHTNFNKKEFKYREYCSISCLNKSLTHKENVKKTCIIKYGVTCSMNSEESKIKSKQTCLQNYGVEHPSQSNEIQVQIKQRNLLKYGVKSTNQLESVQNKKKITNLKRYGCENVFQNDEIKNNIKQQNLNKHGVEHSMQREDIKNKMKQTCIDKYGVTCSMNSEESKIKSKQTCLKRYGVEHISQSEEFKNKIKQTCIDRYGVESTNQLESVKAKSRITSLKNYGVEYPIQNKEIQEKVFKISLQSKPYTLPSGIITYKMGYEPQFLDYVFKNKLLKEDEIDYHPKGIKYLDSNYEYRYYFPDFYIPKWNLIVEIKSDWIMTLDKEVYLKEVTTKELRFNYIRILNYKKKSMLNFDEFNQYIKHFN